MFHCFFTDDSMMILLRSIDVTVKTSMQAVMIFTRFIDLSSKTLLFHSCMLCRWFVDDPLERHNWNFDYFDGNFFDLFCFCFVNLWIIHVSLLLQWLSVDESLKKLWWHYEDSDSNGKSHWTFYCHRHRNVDVLLLLDWLIVADPLKNLW